MSGQQLVICVRCRHDVTDVAKIKSRQGSLVWMAQSPPCHAKLPMTCCADASMLVQVQVKPDKQESAEAEAARLEAFARELEQQEQQQQQQQPQ